MYSLTLLSTFLVISFSTYIVCTTALGTCNCETDTDLSGAMFCRLAAEGDNCEFGSGTFGAETCPCNSYPASNCPTSPISCVLTSSLTILTQDCECNNLGEVCRTKKVSGNSCPGNSFCPCNQLANSGNPGCSNTDRKCSTIGGVVNGDPHFSGFDGSKFDFHGEHQHHYILFAETGGDVFSARTKATNELYHGIKKTYFDQFGLLLCGTSKKLKFDAAFEHGQWVLKVQLDGTHVPKDMSSKQFSISYPSKDRAVVLTEKNKIEVFGVSMRSEFRRHLDFKIAKIAPVKKSDRFAGILGITLSHKLLQEVTGFPNNLEKMEPVTRENTLRAHSEVGSLFPSAAELEKVVKSTN